MVKKKKTSQDAGLLTKIWNIVSPEKKKKVCGLFLILAIIGGTATGTVYTVYSWLCKSDFFQITSMKIEGNRSLSKDMILQLSGVDIHSNLLAIDLAEIKQKIEADAWIDTVRIKRKLPSKLIINIKERSPVALLKTKDSLYYLDKKGMPFVKPGIGADLDFPVISGMEDLLVLDAGPVKTSRLNSLNEALRFLRYARSGSSALPSQNISELNLSDNGQLVLILADHPFPIFLGEKLSRRKYSRLAKVLYWLYKKNEFTSVSYIYLDYTENKVLVGKNKT